MKAASCDGGGASRQQQQVAAAVVERAINLHSAGLGGRQRQVALPTLQQVQRQMQAARAQLEQRRRQWLRESPAETEADGGQRATTQNKTLAEAHVDDDGGGSSDDQQSGRATKTLLLLSSSNRLDEQSNNVEEKLEGTTSDIERHLSGDRFAGGHSTGIRDNAQGGQIEAEAKQDDTNSRLDLLDDHHDYHHNDNNNHHAQTNGQLQAGQLDKPTRQQLEEALEPVTRTMTTLEPVPSSRSFEPSAQLDFKNELTIVTLPSCPLMYQRIRELSNEEASNFSAQSTPNASILSSSDSTTTTTSNSFLTSGADMNSSEMICKLIERLDRKLVVMKNEQLALMKEIELNESNGMRLFESMRGQLTPAEFDKIQMHANEIEKVTRLILSLKLRLKRIEDELKEQQRQQQQQQHQDSQEAVSTPIGLNQNAQEQTSQLFSSSQLDLQAQSNSSSTDSIQRQVSTTGKAQSQQQQQLQQQQQQQRGLSDPTSTSGLPKRNHNYHQHHASLLDGRQLDISGNSLYQSDGGRNGPTTATAGASTSAGSVGVVATIVGELNQVAAKRNQQQGGQTKHSEPNHNATSTSSDSIFNYADSAIGSCTLTSTPNHIGSSNNINDKDMRCGSKKNDDDDEGQLVSDGRQFKTMTNETVSPRTTISYSSLSSTSSERHHQFSSPPPPSHLSSNISVSSHGSLTSSASVPSSPSLMSPISTSSSSNQNEQPRRDSNNNKNEHDNNRSMFSSESSALTLTNCDSIMNLISDVDILLAKRNKLVSQLEEAHQLEEFIGKRNSNIVERILKKYYTDEMRPDGQIALFKQFTKLKSLLLKDSHDINDRIENAEHQLKELRQTNHFGC